MKVKIPHRSTTHQSLDQKLFGLLVSSVKDYAIFMIDPMGYIMSWNKGAEHIKGYTENEVIGKHISIFYTPDEISQNEPQENLKIALAQGSFEQEGWRVRKDGSRFWANVVFTPLIDDGGTLLGFAKVTCDMTEAKLTTELKEQLNIELERRVKENTQKIIEGELRFRALIENSYDGITLLDRDLNTIYRSESAERIVGWKNEERSKYKSTDLVHPDDLALFNNGLPEVLSSPGKVVHLTYRALSKRGNYVWLECIYTNMLSHTAIKAIVCNFRDITEQVKAGEQIKNKTEQIENILERITDGFMTLDKNLFFTYANNQFGEMTGLLPGDIIGKYIWDIFTVASAKVRTNFDQALREQCDVTLEDYYEPLDLWAEDRVYPSEGGLSVFVRDITERKRAERQIKSKTEQIENILESITDGFVALDNNLRYTYVNKRICEMAGLTPPDMLGKYIWDIFPAGVGTPAQEAFNRAVSEQQYVFFEDHYAPLDLWVEEHLYPSASGLSVFARDISERKKAEQKIQLLNESLELKVLERTKQLEAANRELESFSYSVSHDLRTPLRAVAGFSAILRERADKMLPDERDRITKIIVDNAALMGRLIDDLLEFSRLGRMELRFTQTNMDALVKDCIKELTYGIEKPIDFEIADLPFCEADTSMVKQVWMNLLGNAIKYSSKTTHPRINVGAKTGKKYTTYFVKDNGVGFDMKYASKLFGVFQRLHRKDEFDGTGVGLALAKRVTDRHQGKIWAEASEGKGACFYFSMPLKQE